MDRLKNELSTIHFVLLPLDSSDVARKIPYDNYPKNAPDDSSSYRQLALGQLPVSVRLMAKFYPNFSGPTFGTNPVQICPIVVIRLMVPSDKNSMTNFN